jgi:hypothetical protein
MNHDNDPVDARAPSGLAIATDDAEGLRRQIKATQAHLLSSLDELRSEAKHEAQNRVQTLKDQAKDKVLAAVDVKSHAQERPLTLAAAAVATGFLVARRLGRGARQRRKLADVLASAPARPRTSIGRMLLLDVIVPAGLYMLQQSVRERSQRSV